MNVALQSPSRDLLWRALANEPELRRGLETGNLPKAGIASFLRQLGIEGRFYSRNEDLRLVKASLWKRGVRVRGTRTDAIVVLAALHEPTGELAAEVLALAATLHASGVVEVLR